jgi:HSP20 family molecular chaperone IbpA
MNKHAFKQPLIAIGLLALVGAVGAQTYYTHELVRRVAADDSRAPAASVPTPAAGQWDPWAAMHADMMRMQARMDRMFGDASQGFPGMPRGAFKTGGRLTVAEQDGNYVVKADIPGAKDSDIDVNLDGRLLSISSQTQGQEKQTADNGQVVRQESYSNAYQRAFTLPGPVSASGMHSQYQDGVLTVTIPKAS